MAKKKASKKASTTASTTASTKASTKPAKKPVGQAPTKPAAPVAPASDAVGPGVGQPAPAFEMADQSGRVHRLSDYLGRWVVLYFYPRDLTPGCTTEACEFRDALPSFGEGGEGGAVVLGVSTDDAASHDRFRSKHALPFDLLADIGHSVCEAYGVWREKNMYGRKILGVVRTTFLIDPRGVVARRWDKVKAEGHANEVLHALQALRTTGV